MKASLVIMLVAAVALGGCKEAAGFGEQDSAAAHRGRYNGIGIYAADRLWSHMAAAGKPADKAAATTEDDQTIIVVVDSQTGEVRQCGNMSGYCIGMNPWTGPLPGGRTAPTALARHLPDLESEEAAVSNTTTISDTDNTQAP